MIYKSTAKNIAFVANAIYQIIKSSAVPNPLMDAFGETPNPFKGECYVASALLYQKFGGVGMVLYRKKDYANQYHWWIKTDEGYTIDITREQYSIEKKEVPSYSYVGAEKAKPMWFPSYKKRIKVLEEKLDAYMEENPMVLE
jgi:hypothetical protein